MGEHRSLLRQGHSAVGIAREFQDYLVEGFATESL
jgi:hypothetical protein